MPFAEWIVAVYIGAAHTRPSTLTINQPAAGNVLTLNDVAYEGRSFSPPIYYGVRASLFPNASTFGMEVEFIHLKTYARTDREARVVGTQHGRAVDRHARLGEFVEQFSMSHGLNLILVNAVVRRALVLRAAGSPGVGGGAPAAAAATLPHPESSIAGEQRDGYELGAPALHAAAGLEYHLSRRFALIGEYKLTRTAQDVEIARGNARASFTSHHLVVGGSWALNEHRRNDAHRGKRRYGEHRGPRAATIQIGSR
jgi:lipid A oxidase